MEVKFYESAEASLLKFAVILAKSAEQDRLRCERSFRKFRQKKNSPVVRRKQDKKEYPLTALSNEAIRGYSRRFYYLTSFCVPPVSAVWVTPYLSVSFSETVSKILIYVIPVSEKHFLSRIRMLPFGVGFGF